MPKPNLKSLIGKLNETCRSALEQAAALCLSQTHYEVDVEHFLAKLLEAQDTDIEKILRHFEINQSRLPPTSPGPWKGSRRAIRGTLPSLPASPR